MESGLAKKKNIQDSLRKFSLHAARQFGFVANIEDDTIYR